jgi:capsular exopolysaccharide synthesis family protein
MEQTFTEEKEAGSSFDVGRLFSTLIKNFYWFLITLAIFITLAYLYLRYTQPLYKVSTYILIHLPDSGPGALATSPFSDAATAGMNTTDPANEIFKLQSEVLLGRVVDSLRLDISVMSFGRVRSKSEELDALPFSLKLGKFSPESAMPLHNLLLSPTSYTLELDKKITKGYYGQPLIMNGDTIVITLNSTSPENLAIKYGLGYYSRTSAISQLFYRITVEPAMQAGPGMLMISVNDEVSSRAKKIIDVLIHEYDKANLEFKNQALRMEINFLNDRVASVGTELLQQENLVRDFKVAHTVTDVSSSANQLLSNLTQLDTRKNEIESKKQLANIVEANVKNSSGQEQVIGNASGLGDPVLTSLVTKYNDIVLEKNRILDRGTLLDPRLAGINRELQDLRVNILNSLESIKTELRSNSEFLAAQERNTTSRFQTMPEKEKDFVQVNRLLNLKQEMYIFLLQRKEDKHIQLASAQIGESRIIDSRTSKNIDFPKPMMIYGIAVVVALLLPALFILLRMILNKRIQTRKDIQNATSLPIAGEIDMESRTTKEIIVSAGYQSDIAEQFRSLRTNLNYLKQGTAGKVLMITSTMPGEGKSFVSINLANTLATTGKKVILIELDLRRPHIAKTLGINSRPGMTDYLISSDMSPREVVQTNREYENLSFVTCGPVPPNPGELILSKRLQTFFEYMRNSYDYVIVDTPPVGIVSDSMVIGSMVDLTLYILRHRYSYRSSVKILNELSENKKLPHLSIVINSIDKNKGFGKQNLGSYNYYIRDAKKSGGKNGVPSPKKESTIV